MSTSASSSTIKRLLKEFSTIRSEEVKRDALPEGVADEGIGKNPCLLELRPWDSEGEDLFEWTATIIGPEGGCYEGGLFRLSIIVPPSYPTRPPSMSFKTKIWHPNVHWKTGEICLDVLSSQWTPAWTLTSACTAVIALLDAPEADSPLNVDAATVLRTGDRSAYVSAARMYTLLHAYDS